ncbi:unnamed protein product [Owenia fusiformis]|uniref:TIR domain-containing protein n=1 Tax=Owenia fusiformis TaxID=6347 RepID=A0A8S4N0N7_OWEFU|nr:unnamed protein product [Owenia fusiformis]
MESLRMSILTLMIAVNLGLCVVMTDFYDNSCPERCTCLVEKNKLFQIRCREGFSTNELERLFYNLKDNITQLRFTSSQLREIPKSVCILRKLVVLDLSQNHISDIKNTSIGCLSTLSVLNLTNNRIKKLVNNTFSGLTTLKELYIGHNSIQRIDVFAFNKDLESLSLIDLNHNKLEEFDPWVFRLPNARDPNRCITLNVSYNDLQRFTNKINWSIAEERSPWGDCVKIDFQFNSFGRIQTFQDMVKMYHFTSVLELMKLIDMRFYFGNKFYCDCDMFEVVHYLKNVVHGIQIDVSINCFYPKALRGVDIFHAEEDKFQCEVKTDCPANCHCIRRPANDTIVVKCDRLSELPDNVPSGHHIELRLANNAIQSPTSSKAYLRNVTVFDVTNNNMISIDGTLIQILTQTPQTSILLESNNLTYLPKKEWQRLNVTNLEELTLSKNLLRCDCHSLWLKYWLQKNGRIVPDANAIQCHNQYLLGRSLKDVADSDFVCVNWIFVFIQIGVVNLLVLIGFVGVVFVIIDDKRKTPIQVDYDLRLQFDVFISFSEKDKDWVKKDLIDRLMYNEAENDEQGHEPRHWYYVAFADKDFVHGLQITQNIANCISDSRVTLLVLSKNFLQSNWCKYEFRTAHNNALSRKGVKVIIIKCEDLKGVPIDTDLAMHLKSHTFLDIHEPDFYRKLKRVLPVPLYTRLQEDVEDIIISETMVIEAESDVEQNDDELELQGAEQNIGAQINENDNVVEQEIEREDWFSPLHDEYNPRNLVLFQAHGSRNNLDLHH